MQAKVDINIQNMEKRTALHFAAGYGHVEIVKFLLTHGGDKSVQDQYSVSPEDIIANPGVISAEDALKVLGK